MNDHLAGRRRGFFLRLCTANPFYAISAVFVFVGLRASFDVGAATVTFPSWSLLAALAGYTLLLGGMAAVLVRFGNVWDDIRTLLLLVVLMFLVISVAFDEILSREPAEGVACCLGGLGFAAGLSEGLLRALRLRLPARFRVPYHALLALFFAYPAAISPWLHRPTDPALPWALFGFSPAASLLALTLLPAVRRGPGYVRANGSPWRWPLYPWTLFGVLGFGACARSCYLCLSAQYSGAPDAYDNYFSSIFGPYFLVPIGLAAAVLLLEGGLVARNRVAANLALLAPVGLVILALVGHQPTPVYRRFLGQFTTTLGGTPAFLALLLAVGFHAVAAVRRVPNARDGLTASLVALAFVGPGTLTIGDIGAIRPGPLAVAAALQLGLALRRGRSARALVASAGFGVAVMASGIADGWTPGLRTIVGLHLAILATMAVGAAFDDALARALRPIGAVMLGVAGLVVVQVGASKIGATISPEAARLYPVAVGVVAAGYGWLIRCRLYLTVAALYLAGGLAIVAWYGYEALRRIMVGLDQIAWGLISFAVAAAISLAKAGAIQSWWARRRPLAKPRKAEGLGDAV